MEIATSQLPRIVRLALIGAGTAFAWIVVSLLLGLGLGHAHADDTGDGGLLGGAVQSVTATVDATATAATNTVSTGTTGVTAVADTVVESAPAPVQQPVSQIVQTTGTAIAAVTQPVADVASSGGVSGVTQPVVDVLTKVPVVGGVVTGTGLDDAVTDLGGTVDETLGGVAGAVDDTGATIGRPSTADPDRGPLLPVLPGIPGVLAPSVDPAAGAVATLFTAGTDASASLFSMAAGLRSAWVAASQSMTTAVGAVVASTATLAVGLLTAAGGFCLPTSSAGPGGAGPGAWALAALFPLAAHRAWVRRAGPEDEHAPPAPSGFTDVSPD